MRRADRQVTDPEAIAEILESCRVCRVALNDRHAPYVVPLNYGYAYEDGRLVLYFHCAREGKKIDLLRRDGRAGFVIDGGHALKDGGDAACSYGYAYRSIMGHGTLREVAADADKRRALDALMRLQTGREDFAYPDAALDSVAVLALEAEEFSAKARL